MEEIICAFAGDLDHCKTCSMNSVQVLTDIDYPDEKDYSSVLLVYFF